MIDLYNYLLHWYSAQDEFIKLLLGWIIIKNIILRWVSDEIRKYIFLPVVKYFRKQATKHIRVMQRRIRKQMKQAHKAHNHDMLFKHCRIGDCGVSKSPTLERSVAQLEYQSESPVSEMQLHPAL